MHTQAMIDACDTQVRQFCLRIDALELTVHPDKKQVLWRLTTHLSQLELVYVISGTVTHAPSLLYARIYPFKNDAFSLLLHELRETCGLPLSGTYIFPYLDTPQRMTACVALLLDQVEVLLHKLRAWSTDERLYHAARTQKQQEIIRIFNIAAKDLPPEDSPQKEPYYAMLFHSYQQMLLTRFTAAEAPYCLLAQGNQRRALKIYNKWASKNALSTWEQSFLHLLRQGTPLLPPEWEVMQELLPHANSTAEGSRLFLGAGLLWPLFSILFCGIILLMRTIFSAGTLYFAGLPWYFGCVIGVLPALFGGIALRRPLIPLLVHKNPQAALAADRMTNSKKTSVFVSAVFCLALAGCLAMCLMLPTLHVRFYPDRLVYTTTEAMVATEYTTQSYQDITCLYKIGGRYNYQGEFIPRASYVLEFADGSLFDLDGDLDLEETEEKVLPILLPFTGEPVLLPSDRELPGHE